MQLKCIDLITNFTTSKQCPLNCSYCIMDFSNNISDEVISLKSNKLLDRIISFIDYLVDNNIAIDMGQTNGEPLLNYKRVKYILDRVISTKGISYDILSSFAFDANNNYTKVIDLCKKFSELFSIYNINYCLRWSIHMEYFKNSQHIIKHYNRLTKTLHKSITPTIMLNQPRDVTTYVLLKKIIPNIEYHLIIDADGKVPLMSKLSKNQIIHLKESNDYVRGSHVIDRIMNNNFSFTGTKCHMPPLINIDEAGRVFNCPNSYHQFYGNEKYIGNAFKLKNDEILAYATPPESCPFQQCNVCSSDTIHIKND